MTRGLNAVKSKSKALILLAGMFPILVDGVVKMLVSSKLGTKALSRSIRRRVADGPLVRTVRFAS